LKTKYGEPQDLVPKRLQNRLGASFDTFDAVWEMPNLIILFHGEVIADELEPSRDVAIEGGDDVEAGCEVRVQLM
jgi:hypothetical protein